jgi:hypothetical protein
MECTRLVAAVVAAVAVVGAVVIGTVGTGAPPDPARDRMSTNVLAARSHGSGSHEYRASGFNRAW